MNLLSAIRSCAFPSTRPRRRPVGRPRPSWRAGIVMLAGMAALSIAGCRSASLDVDNLGLAPAASGFSAESAHAYPVHGIDVSKYQGMIDWAAARQGGVAFAWLKATEGGDRLDDRFHDNWRGAGAAGVPRGAYHFWYHCRPGVEQAEWFIRNVPRERNALPPVIDIEWTPFSPTCTRRPSTEEIVREVGAMAAVLEKHYGKRPILYIPIDVHRERLVGAFRQHQMWLRAVRDHPKNVYKDRDFHFWQYTESGSVPGISGEVDRNVFAGTRADWIRWLQTHAG
jgi:lysozyme